MRFAAHAGRGGHLRHLGRAARAVALGVLLAATLTPVAAAASTATVVPYRYLRSWDPITVFFTADRGPAGGGPEDHAERFLRLEPAQPGAFTWLDARTLQFRPAEPWPPLGRVALTVDGKSTTLSTLLAPPLSSQPGSGEAAPAPVGSIRLSFADPVDVEALRSALTLELRPLPGLEAKAARVLGAADFRIRPLERPASGGPSVYLVDLATPIPAGTRVLIHFRLALDQTAPEAALDLSFTTGEAFRVVAAGCPETRLPIPPDGVRYGRGEAIACDTETPALLVELSAPVGELGVLQSRNLVRIDPPIGDFDAHVEGREIRISGAFARDTLYRVTLAPAELVARDGRRLEMAAASELYVHFPPREAYLRIPAAHGIVERYGPQMIPLEGRGGERVDLRLQRIDPLDRGLWPFPDFAVSVDEGKRPPSPGEEPPAWTAVDRNPTAQEIAARLAALGSPPVSTLVDVPLHRTTGAAKFGLDLGPHLARLLGKGGAGTVLVGLRRLDRGPQRSWLRLTVTDLALTTTEEERAVVFAVTSIASGQPIAGATVRVEGATTVGGAPPQWEEYFRGATDADGRLRWEAPGRLRGATRQVRRVIVEKDGDTLELDPQERGEAFRDGEWLEWTPGRSSWLTWAVEDNLDQRTLPAERLAHLFTDRPVYRPDETVHIRGILRTRERGEFAVAAVRGALVVSGPGDTVWRYPATASDTGGVYHAFHEAKLPSGEYTAWFEDLQGRRWGQASFRLEAYRLPRFEIELNAPERVPLDREFTVGLLANYYAGGRVTGRPVAWRVTQFPYTFNPKQRPGFLYSSDGRFSRTQRFESSPRLERRDSTDGNGGARLVLNPAIEPTAQPRSYVVEATVTGEDDQTVTSTRQVIALPPFILGLKVPRYVEKATALDPEVLVVGPDDEPLAGVEVTLRLLHRQWHSVLKASDFTDGVARYLTDMVDEKVSETKVVSGKQPVAVHLPLAQAGVYVVEIEAADKLGRSQVVSVDLYAGGAGPIAWPKPVSAVFNATADRPSYKPGDTAHVVLHSPFQKGEALAVVEAPAGNRYSWVKVEGGAAAFDLPIEAAFAPRLPVHLLLERGRLPGTTPQPNATADLGKPTTLAATVWLDVEPTAHRVTVALVHPDRARPGQKIDLEVQLKDERGQPLAGEVTLWLVDQAVLALGREARLDPIPDFLRPRPSRLELRDTRNLAFGFLPFAENPGGESPALDAQSLLERATVRRSFEPVPYYEPALKVGPEGSAHVQIQLPDNLTNFKLRAKATSGAARFGYGSSTLAVRLPVIVQPALPRFLRAGDRFSGAAIARVVEGDGGAGTAEFDLTGAKLVGDTKRAVELPKTAPQRIDFEAEVPTPDAASGAPAELTVRAAVRRSADGASDAFEIKLPIRDDRERITIRQLLDLQPGQAAPLPALPEPARPGSARRTVVASANPALLRLQAGLDFLRGYPYGCTEQRLSTVRAELALKAFNQALAVGTPSDDVDRAVTGLLGDLPKAIDANGLVAYWPGGPGYVSLTAWSLEFARQAKTAGYPVDEKLLDGLERALAAALRSDFGHFIDGESLSERIWALSALAIAGKPQPAYAAELLRRGETLDLESTALLLDALERQGETDSPAARELRQRLWQGIVLRLYQGKSIYGGLQDTATARNALILPSETRTLAEITRALAPEAKDPRYAVLVDGLVGLGRDDGWGSTQANAAALLALARQLQPPFAGAEANRLEVRAGERTATLQTGPEQPLARLELAGADAGELRHSAGTTALGVRLVSSYLPAEDGGHAKPAAAGFVVTREAYKVLAEDKPLERLTLAPGATIDVAVGQVLEERVEVVNPQDRQFVAITMPLAAGLEPLNPALATAPPEATPRGKTTLRPTYSELLDDRVAYYFDELPRGTYSFYVRTRAATAGSFIQPPAKAEMMYDAAVRGSSAGVRVRVTRPAPDPAPIPVR